jgi:hypothetical protein
VSWPPVLDGDTSQRREGESWRASYTNDGNTIYVEAVKLDGVVYIAPLGSDLRDDPMVWISLGGV